MTHRPIRPFTRRRFLQTSAGALAVPMFVPAHVLGHSSPGNALRIGAIGTGRMGMGDLGGVLEQGLREETHARVVAVCDVDQTRALAAKQRIEAFYGERLPGAGPDVKVYRDFRELLARDDIDAVTVSTPEHWHALVAIAAAKAGKGVYVQKPMTYSHREGQLLVRAVRESGAVLQVGSQQRSDARFRTACELVRNGHLGKLQRIHVFLPPDSGVGKPREAAIPAGFDFDLWRGPTAAVPFAEAGVHPPSKPDGTPDFGRPDWLQMRRYCLGMITGWGSHMNDIAQWGHGGDRDSGPVEIEASAEYPERGLFDVHTKFRAVGRYADGVELIQETGRPAGVRFHGERGTIWVQRGKITADPKGILEEQIAADGTQLYVSENHYRNWLACVRAGEEPICPVEVGHRSNTICVITDIAMQLGRKLRWDPAAEHFVGDDEANGLLDYEHRAPWSMEA